MNKKRENGGRLNQKRGESIGGIKLSSRAGMFDERNAGGQIWTRQLTGVCPIVGELGEAGDYPVNKKCIAPDVASS